MRTQSLIHTKYLRCKASLQSPSTFISSSARQRSTSSMSLHYDPDRAIELRSNIDLVLKEIQEASSSVASDCPRLVSVSKLKPASDIKALYDVGHRHFGENYIQELAEKAEILPVDIRWHFIGSLQSNKSKLAASIPNLYLLETLTSIKVADLLQKNLTSDREGPLNVYIQINTSGEDAKSGLSPTSPDLMNLAVHVITSCPGLRLLGLMTIGSWEASHDPTQANPDFTTLKKAKETLTRALREKGHLIELELSMGMSADFCHAAREGSNSVRVGTRIFGERTKKV